MSGSSLSKSAQLLIDRGQQIDVALQRRHLDLRREHLADVVLRRDRIEDERIVGRPEHARRDGVDRVNVHYSQRREARPIGGARPQLRDGAAVHRILVGAAGQARVAGQPVERGAGVVARLVHRRDRANDRVLVGQPGQARHQFANLNARDVGADGLELAAVLGRGGGLHIEHISMRRPTSEPDADHVLGFGFGCRPQRGFALRPQHVEHGDSAHPQAANAEEVPAVNLAEQRAGIVHERALSQSWISAAE